MNFWQETHWFAVQSKPHAESLSAEGLRRLDLEVFLPKVRVLAPVGGIRRWVIKALFPGYCFARFVPLMSLNAVRSVRGVLRVVGSTRTPLPLAPEIVHTLRERVAADGFVPLEPRPLQPGDRVRIEGGPFAGWMGRVEREPDDRRRVCILLEALQQARVWLDEVCLEVAGEAA